MRVNLKNTTICACYIMRQLISVLFTSAIMSAMANAETSIPNENVRLTFSISDLYAPYLTSKENADVLKSLNSKVSVVVTYKHTSSKFKWTSNMSGVTGLISPGYIDNSTEQYRMFELSAQPGKQQVSGVDIPQSLAGNYIMDKLFVSVSPNVFFQQSGYRDLVQKELQNDNEKYSASFEYNVSFEDSSIPARITEHQECLSISTPLGIPDIPIPVVTNVEIHSNKIRLLNNIYHACPLVNTKYTSTSAVANGHLPAIRVASAQADIDFAGSDGVKFSSGALPVTEDMTRLYNSNDTGISAWVREYGQFEIFSISIRDEQSNAVGDVLPIQTESWSFYNKKLVKHYNEILYISTEKKPTDWIREGVYFQNGQQVGYVSKTQNCTGKECQKIQAKVKSQLAKSFEEQNSEVQGYKAIYVIQESSAGH